jgi:serine/threonine-protein kinase
MIREDGLVKVLDFGIAKYRPTQNGQKALIETEAGEIIGTAAYMSPEQARGLEVDAQTDVWSLGVILYEMLAGKLPFAGATKSDRIAAILEHEPAPLAKTGGKVSAQLQQIVDRALTKDKRERYPDIAEMAEDLHLLRNKTGDKISSSLILPIRRRRRLSRRAYRLAAFSLLALLVGAFGLWFYLSKVPKSSVSEKRSIAVLPLKPINPAARDELYEVGIADSLIQRLGLIKGFVVRPLSSVRKYANIEQDALAAGREQQADYVLASNYQIAGGKIRVTSQLFNVETGQVEETYKSEKETTDVFAMQDAVANEVGRLLQSRFALTSGTPATTRGTDNEEAYRLYLQGVYFNDKRLPPDGEKAVEFFEQAVRLDPNYARAWAGVAFAHRSLIDIGADVDYQEQHRISMEAVNKALALDPNLSEAYNALCINKLNYEYDVDGAETACKRAIELDPNSPLAHNTYSRLLFSSQRKRFDEAIAEIKTAIDLDPTAFYHQLVYTFALTMSRRYDEAVPQLERLAQRNPKRALISFWLVSGVAFQGKEAEDFERLTRFEKLAETNDETIKAIETAYQTDGWQGVLREHAEYNAKHDQTFYFTACAYAQAGDEEKALEYLEKTYQHREHWMEYLRVDPRFDSLRDDPRFEALVRRVESK